MSAAVNALCGLLPNIGGAGVAVRRLYECVVQSRALCRRSILLLRKLCRVTAIRIVRGYRTVSASPPWELQALALRRKYSRLREPDPGADAARDVRGTAEEETWDRWRSQLISEESEHRSVEAVLPSWKAWRRHGGLPLTYRMTQMLTGHGVFGLNT